MGPRPHRKDSNVITRIQCGPRMSQAVVANGFVFTAGQVANAPAGASVAEQTRQVLGQIDDLLAAAGSSKRQIVSANIWLADIADFSEMNTVWDEWVAEGASPARATVEARLAAPQFRVEIAVIACV